MLMYDIHMHLDSFNTKTNDDSKQLNSKAVYILPAGYIKNNIPAQHWS